MAGMGSGLRSWTVRPRTVDAAVAELSNVRHGRSGFLSVGVLDLLGPGRGGSLLGPLNAVLLIDLGHHFLRFT